MDEKANDVIDYFGATLQMLDGLDADSGEDSFSHLLFDEKQEEKTEQKKK